MAKYQTRRSISISGPLYARVLAHARSQGRTMSGLLEEIFTTHLAPPQDPPTVTPNDVDRMTLAVAYREQAKHAPLSLVPCVVCGGSRVYTKRVRRRVRRDRHAVRQRRARAPRAPAQAAVASIHPTSQGAHHEAATPT